MSLQISVHRRLTVFQLELDDITRERHDEVLDVSRMSELEREVRAINVDVKTGYSIYCMYDIAAASYGNTCEDW